VLTVLMSPLSVEKLVDLLSLVNPTDHLHDLCTPCGSGAVSKWVNV